MSEQDRARWDERYQTRGARLAESVAAPTAFAPYEELFPTEGRALDLACGAGAASVWLARRGLHVCHRFRDRRLDQAIIDRLAPGGLLAISVLSSVGAEPGPFRAAPGELTAVFAALSVIAADEGEGEVGLLARK